MKQAVLTDYRIQPGETDPPRSGSLVEILGIGTVEQPAAVAETIRWLLERVRVGTDRETGLIELAVKSRWPSLSFQIADRLLELVNQFNLEIRQTQATAERGFIEEQLEEAEASLLAAEERLERFLQRNRRYENSPELVFQLERLQRRVGLRQGVYNSLAQSYEQAKIDEVRNTPVITVVERPELPHRPDPTGMLQRLMLAGVLGLMLAALWIFAQERISVTEEGDRDEYEELARVTRKMRESLRDWRERLGRLVARDRDGED